MSKGRGKDFGGRVWFRGDGGCGTLGAIIKCHHSSVRAGGVWTKNGVRWKVVSRH